MISAMSDDVVEADEEFMVVMTLKTSGTSLSTGNNVTRVTILDSDGIAASTPLKLSSFSTVFSSSSSCLLYNTSYSQYC